MKINENLVSQLSLLAAGSACVALGGLAGGATIAFGVFAAPVVGVGTWGLAKWMKRFQTKDPKAHKTIQEIQARINSTVTGDARFTMIDNETKGFADQYLANLLPEYWPAPKIITELATDINGFPNAIANYILDEINGADLEIVPEHFFEQGQARHYVELIITIALNASLEDEDYFKTLQPRILMQNLKLTGQIKRDVEGFIEKLDALQHFLGEILDRIEDKVDQVLTILRDGKTASPEEQDSAKRTIREMLSSERQATQNAVKEIMANPPNPVAATNLLKQAIVKQKGIRSHAIENERALLKQVATINYYINSKEADVALENILELKPDDMEAKILKGLLKQRLGDLRIAKTLFGEVFQQAKLESDKEYLAISLGNIGAIEFTLGNISEAKKCFQEALKLNIDLGREVGVANQYGNLGVITRETGDLDNALKFFEKSLSINKALGRGQVIAIDFANIGIVEKIRNNLVSAKNYSQKALEISILHNDQVCLAGRYLELGNVEDLLGSFKKAEELYKQSLEICRNAANKAGMAHAYGSLANIMQKTNRLPKAGKYYREALNLHLELGDMAGIATDYGNIGNQERLIGNHKEAEKNYKKSIENYEKIGFVQGLIRQYTNLGELEKLKGRKVSAKNYLTKALKLSESQNNRQFTLYIKDLLKPLN